MKKIFMQVELMSISEVRAEATNICKAYPSTKSMPTELFIRINLLLKEIKRKESYELMEKRKNEAIEFERKIKEEKATYDTNLILTEEVLLIIDNAVNNLNKKNNNKF